MLPIVTVLSLCMVRGSLVVHTRLGEVRGLKNSEDGSSMFLGIPYALVDEDNPFAPAIPHPVYEAPIEAYNDEIKCPQPNGSGTLQCLVLNVHVPAVAVADPNPLPVVVWIHQGAFILGSAASKVFDPKFLLRHDVIFVSVNYRLGIYGFMCTDSPKSPGNNGLKDQLIALRWVRDNIREFGGDRKRVTLFGESSGGMNIHIHLLSHHEKLFDRAIIQSGPSTSPWSFVEADNTIPIEVAKELGFDTADLDKALDFLAKCKVHDVVDASTKLLVITTEKNNQPLTKTCVEKEFEGVERFVTMHSSIAHSAKAKDIDVIIGYNNQEMIFDYDSEPDQFFRDYSFQSLLDYDFNTTNFYDMLELVEQFYIGEDNSNLREKITNFASDFLWNYPTEHAVRLLLEDGVRVYQYVFSYEGNRNFFKSRFGAKMSGASHTDELGYLFDMEIFRAQQMTVEDQLTMDRMTTLWTNFAKYGDPLPEPTALLPVSWSPATVQNHSYLKIDREVTTSTRPFHERMAFWALFYSSNLHRVKWLKRDTQTCNSGFEFKFRLSYP